MTSVERELKLGVAPGFELPDLGLAVVQGGTMGSPQQRRLEAVYYDTPDLRLLRRGVTLRHRTGDAGGPVWTLKLPSGAMALGLSRRELSVTAKPGVVPRMLADVARGWGPRDTAGARGADDHDPHQHPGVRRGRHAAGEPRRR